MTINSSQGSEQKKANKPKCDKFWCGAQSLVISTRCLASRPKIAGSSPSVVTWCCVLCSLSRYYINSVIDHPAAIRYQLMQGVNLQRLASHPGYDSHPLSTTETLEISTGLLLHVSEKDFTFLKRFLCMYVGRSSTLSINQHDQYFHFNSH